MNVQRCPSQRQKETLANGASMRCHHNGRLTNPIDHLPVFAGYCLYWREPVHARSETQSKVPLDRTCIHGHRIAFERLLIRIYEHLILPDPTVHTLPSPTRIIKLSNRTKEKKKIHGFLAILLILRSSLCNTHLPHNNNVTSIPSVCIIDRGETATRVLVLRNVANL